MKIWNKIIIVLFISLVPMTTVFSQSHRLSLNPEIGINLNSFNIDDGLETIKKNTAGFKVGGFVSIQLYRSLYLEPGAYFDMRNARIQESYQHFIYENDYTINYLTIPVNFGIDIPLGPLGTFMMNAGPTISWGVSGKNEISINGIKDKIIEAFDQSQDGSLNQFDFGFTFGAGYKFPFNVFIRGQYVVGLGDISNTNNLEISNSSWQLLLGYSLKVF